MGSSLSSISLTPRARLKTRCLTGPLAAVTCSGDTSSARPCSQEHSFGSVRHKPLTFFRAWLSGFSPRPQDPLSQHALGVWSWDSSLFCRINLAASPPHLWCSGTLTWGFFQDARVCPRLPSGVPGYGFLCSGYLTTYDVLSYLFCFC